MKAHAQRLAALLFAVIIGSAALQLSGVASATPLAPNLTKVVVQPDQRTVEVTWQHTGQTLVSYEIWWRTSGTSTWKWVSSSAGGTDSSWVPYASAQSTYVERLKMPASVAKTKVDIGIKAVQGTCPPDSNCSNLDNAKITKIGMKAAPKVTLISDPTSIQVNWTAASGSFPFVSYDVFLKPTSYPGPIEDCWSTWEGTRKNTTKSLTSVPAGCGGGAVQPQTQYQVGVRTIQQTGAKPVWTTVRVATATTPSALPAHCQSTDELFCTDFPNGFVKTAAWPAAQQGDPVTMNGANIKHAPYLNGSNWTTPAVVDEINNGFGSSSAPDWNVIRLNMDWPTYQIEQGGSVTVDPVALQELDTVIDAAKAQGLYVILVPAHTRWPGSLCGMSTRMADATHDIPKWMWDIVAPSLTPECKKWSTTAQDLEDEVFARPEFKTYIRTLADRYSDFSTSAKADRSETVVALDLINEPKGDGGVQSKQSKMIANYTAIVQDVRANSTATNKILMAEPTHGDTSLAQNSADLATFAASSKNLMWSFHDYFGGGTDGSEPPTDPTWGYGRSSYGFPKGQDRTDSNPRPYTYGNEAAQHRTYVEQVIGWSTAQGLPVYIGEYGVYNPCWGNVESEAMEYATQTRDLYDSIPISPGSSTTAPVSRTWWINGSSNAASAMELRRASTAGPAGCGPEVGGYFAHAAGTT